MRQIPLGLWQTEFGDYHMNVRILALKTETFSDFLRPV